MTVIITIANEKGGTGKTTTAVNLAAGLALMARHRRRPPGQVLLLDLDPSANALMSVSFRGHQTQTSESLYALLRQTPPPSIQRLIRTSEHHPNLGFVPTDPEAMQRLARDEIFTLPRRENRLERALRPVIDAYEFIVIDTPPGMGYMLTNALVVSTHVLIPVKLEYFDIVGLQRLIKHIRQVQVEFEHTIQILGYLPTMVQTALAINQNFSEVLEGQFGDQVLPAIHLSSHIKVAHAAHQDIFTAYPPRSRAGGQLESSSRPTQEFGTLVEEIVRRTTSPVYP
ncbi:MAG TPA: ParA family protein [Anaerolineales bacterium]|nr:ParA family protein [Anaerolineales bacterium]